MSVQYFVRLPVIILHIGKPLFTIISLLAYFAPHSLIELQECQDG